jgi:hypothetical protein
MNWKKLNITNILAIKNLTAFGHATSMLFHSKKEGNIIMRWFFTFIMKDELGQCK